jgi:hypothetical protein
MIQERRVSTHRGARHADSQTPPLKSRRQAKEAVNPACESDEGYPGGGQPTEIAKPTPGLEPGTLHYEWLEWRLVWLDGAKRARVSATRLGSYLPSWGHVSGHHLVRPSCQTAKKSRARGTLSIPHGEGSNSVYTKVPFFTT